MNFPAEPRSKETARIACSKFLLISGIMEGQRSGKFIAQNGASASAALGIIFEGMAIARTLSTAMSP